MNAKQKEALKRFQGAFEDLVDVLVDDDAATAEPTETKKTRGSAAKSAPVKETKKTAAPGKKSKSNDDEEKGVNGYSLSELEDMGYNGMKALAKKLGFVAKGDRDAIANMIMTQTPPEPEDEDEDEAPAPKKDKKPAPGKKSPRPLGKKQPDPEPEDEDEDDDDEDEDDGIEALVMTATSELSDEELLDFLLEAGIKAKGKRQALIAAVVKGVRDGKIELDDDGEDEDDSEDEDDESEDSGASVNDPENPNMTEERLAGIEALVADIKAQFKSKELSRKDIVDYINEYSGTKDKMTKVTDKELLAKYIDIACLFVDDDGEMPDDEDPEAYTVNGDPYCCGHELKYDEDGEQYICEYCGKEYPADDED